MALALFYLLSDHWPVSALRLWPKPVKGKAIAGGEFAVHIAAC